MRIDHPVRPGLRMECAVDAAYVAACSVRPVQEHELRMAALGRDAGEPTSAARAAAAGRWHARTLRSVEHATERTRAWPLPGGVAAWERAAAADVPGWRPEPLP